MDVRSSRESTYALYQGDISQEGYAPNGAALHGLGTSSGIFVAIAGEHHLEALKQLSDQHKRELGFVNREILRKAISTRSLLIAGDDPSAPPIGMLHFYMRRDSIVTLYSIAVTEAYRKKGTGRLLFHELVNIARISGKTQIRLKCPIDLPANAFYQYLGLEILMIEPGKRRSLNVWVYNIKD